MAKRKNSENISGSTFADLYDAQEELSRQGVKPMGRPKNKTQRKPTTVYLTKEENTMLRRLHLTISEHIPSANKSQIVGMSIQILFEMMTIDEEDNDLLEGTRTLESVKRKLVDGLVL